MSDTSEDLLERARKLEKDALVEVYDQYNPGLYRYAFRLLGDSCLAEDCVAETFNRFLQALERNAGPRDHLQAYLYRIAHNWAADFYRNRSHIRQMPLDDETNIIVDEPRLHEDAIEKQRLRMALFQLTSDQRLVIILKFIEGWQNEEIAVVVNKPIGAIKALQHRALHAMRRILGADKDRTND